MVVVEKPCVEIVLAERLLHCLEIECRHGPDCSLPAKRADTDKLLRGGRGTVAWYHLMRPDDAELDALAERFHLHPLHIEDARSDGERVKVEGARNYTFALLKTFRRPGNQNDPLKRKIVLFANHQQDCPAEEKFFIVVADTREPDVAAALRKAEMERDCENPVRLLYLVFDSLVDSYFPAIDALDNELDALEDRVVSPGRNTLSEIFALKEQLVNARRLLGSTRDAAMHLQRDGGIPMSSEHQLYLRDLYDHISRLLDTVETQRDMLNNALDIYLSSITNRSNEVMKVLTVLSTMALPALVVSGVYGMNVSGLPFVHSHYAAEIVLAFTALVTGGLLGLFRYLRWL